MKRPIFFMSTVVIICSIAGVSFAIVSDEAQPDDVISSIVEERANAKQEYQRHKLREESRKKESPAKVAIGVKTPSFLEVDSVYTKNKSDVITGTGAILVAIILSVYLYLSKKKQSP